MVTFIRIPLLVLFTCLVVVTSVPAEPVKLAVFLPFRNVYKDEGKGAKQGFELGIQEEVAAQKVPWESWITLEYFDTRADADRTLELVKDAIANGAKAVLGLFSSKVALNIQDYVLNEARVEWRCLKPAGIAAWETR